MSENKNDGGSAFPEIFTEATYDINGDVIADTYSAGGITKRDYFAAAALTGIIAMPKENRPVSWQGPGWLKEAAYGYADQMLEESDQ